MVTPALLVPGLVVARARAMRVRDQGAFAWLSALREHGVVAAPARDADDLLGELQSHAGALTGGIAALTRDDLELLLRG